MNFIIETKRRHDLAYWTERAVVAVHGEDDVEAAREIATVYAKELFPNEDVWANKANGMIGATHHCSVV